MKVLSAKIIFKWPHRNKLPNEYRIGRAKPDQWALYATALLISSIRSTGTPARFANKIKKKEFKTRRNDCPQHFDGSKKRIGRQALRNRIHDNMERVQTLWWQPTPKATLKTYLKQVFLQ